MGVDINGKYITRASLMYFVFIFACTTVLGFHTSHSPKSTDESGYKGLDRARTSVLCRVRVNSGMRCGAAGINSAVVPCGLGVAAAVGGPSRICVGLKRTGDGEGGIKRERKKENGR